jgi:F-type H+-transporting ATPase subunit epsilon
LASKLQVDIVTPERRAFQGEASEVVLPAWNGELGVYPDHDAMLALVRPGACTVVTVGGVSQGQVHRFVLGRGFAEITGERVTLLTDSCDPVSTIDRSRAEKDLHQAEQEMATLDPQSEKYRQAQQQYDHARARLDAV